MPEEVQIKLTDIKKLTTSTKFDEDDRDLVTTLKAEVRAHPVVLARILNLQKQGAPMYLIIGTPQAVMDLQFTELEKPKSKARKVKEPAASKETAVEPDAPPPAAEEATVVEKVEEPVAVA